MNILYVFEAPIIPFVGGVQRVTETIAKGLLQAGHRVFFLSYGKPKFDYSDYIAPQLYITIDFNGSCDYENQYKDILDKYHINVVIFQQSRDEDLLLMSLTPTGIKKIACNHLQPFASYGNAIHILKSQRAANLKELIANRIYRLFPSVYERRSLRNMSIAYKKTIDSCDYYCLLSERFIPRLTKFMPDLFHEKIIAINNPNTFTIPKDSCWEEKENAVLWVGRVENSPKNLTGFLDVWKCLQDRNPDWIAYVVGAGRDLDYCKYYAVKKNIINVKFEGRQSDVIPYYKKCKFVCVTSYNEGWGMVLTEAMAYECVPCAYSTYESLYDIIDDNIDGIIVNPFNASGYADRMFFYINNTKELQSLSRNAKIKVKSFDSENIVKQWIKVIEK